MNAVIMRLALRSLLGSRRVWILIGLSVLLFAVAGLTRWGSGGAVDVATGVIVNFGFGLLVAPGVLLGDRAASPGVVVIVMVGGSVARDVPRQSARSWPISRGALATCSSGCHPSIIHG